MEDQDYMQSIQQIKAAIDAHIQAFPNAEAIQDLLGILMADAYGRGKGMISFYRCCEKRGILIPN